MKPTLKAALYKSIEQWLVSVCEHDDWPQDALVHPELSQQMASAAEIVFDATVGSSIYTQDEGAVFHDPSV